MDTSIKAAEARLNSLGAFKFAEKNKEKALIKQYTQEAEDAENRTKEALQAYDEAVKNAQLTARKDKDAIEKDAEEAFPTPKPPQKPSWMRPYSKDEKMKAILRFLVDSGGPRMITEIKNNVPEVYMSDPQAVSTLVRELNKKAKVDGIDRNGKAYFKFRSL